MLHARYALAAAVACLIGGVAAAQPAPSDNTAPPATSEQAAPPAAQPEESQAPTGAATNTTASVNAQGVRVIASAPVPDTPENRARYGQPLSRAGRRTKPAGN